MTARKLEKSEYDSVTIVGCGATGFLAVPGLMRGEIPCDARNPVWVVNFGARTYHHTHAWNTHDLNELTRYEPDKDFIGFYKGHHRPLVTLVPVKGLRNVLIYPLEEVVDYWQDDYFFASPSYMLAYAAWCGAKLIRMYGTDFDYAERTDYEAGRCCTEYWMGRLRQAGHNIWLPDQTTLLDLHWKNKGGRIGYGAPYGYFDKVKILRDPDTGRMSVARNLGNSKD